MLPKSAYALPPLSTLGLWASIVMYGIQLLGMAPVAQGYNKRNEEALVKIAIHYSRYPTLTHLSV